MLSDPWILVHFGKGIRSFQAWNIGSAGQRASKLLAFKVGGLTKKSTIRPRPHSNQSAWVRGGPGSNHSQILMAGNFVALWPTDPKFLALKDLNLFKIDLKFQEASSILMIVFALSKWPHFHRVYLVTVYKQSFIAVDRSKNGLSKIRYG